MHELSLALSLVAQVDAKAQAVGAKRVLEIWLEVGALAAVEEDALRLAFTAAGKGTCLEAATLTLVPVAGLAHCPRCELEVALSDPLEPCPGCGLFGLSILSGDQLRILEMEVE